MLRKRIKRLPVLENNKLIGVVGRTDLLKALTAKLIETKDGGSDDDILAYIKGEIDKAKWAPKSGLRVAVKDKVVTLDGTIFSDEERRAVITIAENAPGVKEVKDKLMFVDPGSGLAFPRRLMRVRNAIPPAIRRRRAGRGRRRWEPGARPPAASRRAYRVRPPGAGWWRRRCRRSGSGSSAAG